MSGISGIPEKSRTAIPGISKGEINGIYEFVHNSAAKGQKISAEKIKQSGELRDTEAGNAIYQIISMLIEIKIDIEKSKKI